MEKTIQRLVLLSGNHLCNNPRVVKEADALASAGYQVEVLGSGVSLDCQRRDFKLAAGKRWRFAGLLAGQGRIQRLRDRAICFSGKIIHRVLGLENRWQLGSIASELLKQGMRRNADLYIAHSEPGMWAAEQLRLQGKKVGVDMEDWFSEDLLPEARRNRPMRLLKRLEKKLLCRGAHSSCTSEVMADALVKKYGCRRPAVVRNVFPLKDREGLDGKWKDRPGMARWMDRNDPTADRPKEAPVSIHWFSQTIGPGRGLEILFQALEEMEANWELHLRGNLKGYENWLEQACSTQVRQNLTLHGLVENEDLLARIAEHDIGYAGELREPISRNLTITNKIFQYLQAGLAVVASDTVGQMEAASDSKGAVIIFRGGERASLAEKLESLLKDRGSLQKTRHVAWQAGERLTWESESKRLQAALP